MSIRLSSGNSVGNLVYAAIYGRTRAQGLDFSFAEANTDSFGRLRVANPQNLLEVTHIRDSNPSAISESTTGLGSSSYDANSSSVVMSVTGTGTVIRQSRRRGIYQPGKGLLIYLTGVLNNNDNAATVTSRIGYYDADDGIYIEYADGLNIVIRSSSSGSLVETRIAQENWNIATLDGTIISAPVLDPSKLLIYFIELEWLGAGYATLGCIIDGEYHYLHRFRHSNIEEIPYIASASLPLRYELISTGGSGQLRQVCGTVISEGGFDPIGRLFATSMGVTSKSVGTTTGPLLALRLKSAAAKVNVKLVDTSVISTSKSNAHVQIWLFRDLAIGSILTAGVTTFVSAGSTSAIEYNVGATAVNTSSGELLNSRYFSDDTDSTSISEIVGDNARLTTNLSGVADVIVIAVQTLSGSDDFLASVTWQEYI